MDQQGINRVEVVVLMMIVISIIFVYMFFVLDLQKSIRDTKRHQDIETIAKELDVHYNNQPDQFCQDATVDSYCSPDPTWFNNNKVPFDPLGSNYLGLPKVGDKSYQICATLEKGGQYCQKGQ